MRIEGVSPSDREPRVLDVVEENGEFSLWIHSPDSTDNGWRILISRNEALKLSLALEHTTGNIHHDIDKLRRTIDISQANICEALRKYSLKEEK